MIFRLLLPIALALLSGCSFDSAAAAPANCTLQYLDGKAPLIPEKQRSKSREICYSSFAALHSGVSRTALWSAEFLSKDRIGSARKIERTSERSEEHTSELQSLMRISYAVFCLKKKKNTEQSKQRRRTSANTVKVINTREHRR